jgi:lipopolysaccharide export system permease protein
MKIWKKHLLLELLKFMAFFLLGCFILYTIIDFSLHSRRFLSYGKNLEFLPIYYLSLFFNNLSLFLPLALLLSMIKILSHMNQKGELVSLQMGGLSLRKLFAPIGFVALLSTIILYANFEFFYPVTSQRVDAYQASSLKKKKHKASAINVLLLKDGSKLIYHAFDYKNLELKDIFWIKSLDEVWHINTLKLASTAQEGLFVDVLIRGKNDGLLQKENSFEHYPFKFKFKTATASNATPPENRSLSSLLQQLFTLNFSSQKEKTALLTQLNFKLALPLLPLLIAIALFPLCVKFSRNLPTFFIATLALLGAVIFFAMLDASLILGENGVVSPVAIVWIPFALLFLFFGKRFIRCATDTNKA